MVLCPVCRYFHLPRFNPGQEPHGPERDRACLTDETERMKAFRPLLPLRFDMVAAILRSHRHNNEIYSPKLIRFDKEYVTNSTAKIKVKIRARVMGSQLIIKSELRLMPGVRRGDSCVMVPTIVEALKHHNLMVKCQHHTWDIAPYVFGGFEPNADLKTRFHHNCLWNHGAQCNDRPSSSDDTRHINRGHQGLLCRYCCTNRAHHAVTYLMAVPWWCSLLGRTMDMGWIYMTQSGFPITWPRKSSHATMALRCL